MQARTLRLTFDLLTFRQRAEMTFSREHALTADDFEMLVAAER